MENDNQTKYVDLAGLQRYDELLKEYISSKFEWGQLGTSSPIDLGKITTISPKEGNN